MHVSALPVSMVFIMNWSRTNDTLAVTMLDRNQAWTEDLRKHQLYQLSWSLKPSIDRGSMHMSALLISMVLKTDCCYLARQKPSMDRGSTHASTPPASMASASPRSINLQHTSFGRRVQRATSIKTVMRIRDVWLHRHLFAKIKSHKEVAKK